MEAGKIARRPLVVNSITISVFPNIKEFQIFRVPKQTVGSWRKKLRDITVWSSLGSKSFSQVRPLCLSRGTHNGVHLLRLYKHVLGECKLIIRRKCRPCLPRYGTLFSRSGVSGVPSFCHPEASPKGLPVASHLVKILRYAQNDKINTH